MDFINSFASSSPTIFAISVIAIIVGFIYWNGRD